MKSLGLVALVVIASWCASCENVNAQAPAGGSSTGKTGASASGAAASSESSAPGMPPVPKPPEPSPTPASSEQAIINEQSANNAHLSTPGGDAPATSFPALRQFLEDSQNAHDKMIVDRFLTGVAVLFAVIAAALLFSLPPKPREQKE